AHVTVGRDTPENTIMDETASYTEDGYNHYVTTKVLAEKVVIQANGTKTSAGNLLHTGSIRPVGIYGPRDGFCVEIAWKAYICGQKGWTSLAPHVLQDWVYVENLVLAHLLLESKLRTAPEIVG